MSETSYLEQLLARQSLPRVHTMLSMICSLLAAGGKPWELGRARQARRGLISTSRSCDRIVAAEGMASGRLTERAKTTARGDRPLPSRPGCRPCASPGSVIAGDAVGHAGAPLVEQKQAPQHHQPAVEATIEGFSQFSSTWWARLGIQTRGSALHRPPGMRCGHRRSSHTASPVALAQCCA